MINNMQSSLTKRSLLIFLSQYLRHLYLKIERRHLVLRFQAIWEDLCSARSMYENKCKRRIQRQLEIGQCIYYFK